MNPQENNDNEIIDIDPALDYEKESDETWHNTNAYMKNYYRTIV